MTKNPECQAVLLETAHPSKFLEDVEAILNKKVSIPARLAELADKKKDATLLDVNYEHFKSYLLDKF